MAKAIIRNVQETVVTVGDPDEESRYMQECLAGLAAPTNPGTRVICLYGNCGVGKSSLINATLGVEGASLKTGDGGAGTLVPIEIGQSANKQPFPFAALVFYYPPLMCEEIVKSHFIDYYNARTCSSDERSTTDPGKPALKALMALFGDKKEFQDEAAAVRFIGKAASADDTKVLNMMRVRTREIVSELAKLGNVTTIYRYTAMDLNRALELFTQYVEDPEIEGTGLECEVWPFVKVVRKYFSNAILAKGIVFVDLPGLALRASDTNRQRVQLAKNYFRSCHQAIVVHSIERAEDDQSLESYILDFFNRMRSGSVAVVLTRSDDIEQEANGRIRYTRGQQEVLRSLDEYEQEVDDELKIIKKRTRYARGTVPSVESVEKQGRYEYLKKHIKCRRTEILVEARNAKIRKSLQDWYRSATNDPQELPVFYASSKCYMAHIKGLSPFDPVLLSVGTTEIPAVRSYLFSVAAKSSKVNALQHYCVQIKSLLHQMELSCIGFKPMMKRDHLLKIVDGARKGVEKQVQGVQQELQKRSITPILIKFDNREAAWLEKTGSNCDKWSNYTYGGHLSFMKHEGDWKTAACGKANWNHSLIEIVREDIQPSLDQLLDEGCHIFRYETVQAMSDLIDSMEQNIKDNLDFAQINAFKAFFNGLRDRKKTTSNIIDDATKTMRRLILALNNDTVNDGSSSPFTISMRKIYKDSIRAEPSKKKPTKHAARCAHFRAAVCARKGGPYAVVKRYLEKGFKQVMQQADKDVVVHCEKVLDAVLRDFNQVCPERQDNGVQALKRREVLGRRVKEGRDERDGPLTEMMMECGVVMD